MKKSHEILTALYYKPLYDINRSKKRGKNVQAAAYNGLFKVNLEFIFSFPGFSFSGLDLVFKSGFQT
jgi:hypothetical protein